MRTTVDLDDDVLAVIDRLRQGRSMGLSEAVNELIRASLGEKRPRVPFHQRAQSLGLSVDVSNVAEVIEQLEGPASR